MPLQALRLRVISAALREHRGTLPKTFIGFPKRYQEPENDSPRQR